jgi:hypothetical protein
MRAQPFRIVIDGRQLGALVGIRQHQRVGHSPLVRVSRRP